MAEGPEPGCLSECRRVQGEGSLVRGPRAGVGPKEGVSGIPTSSHFPQQAAKCSGEATPTPRGVGGRGSLRTPALRARLQVLRERLT